MKKSSLPKLLALALGLGVSATTQSTFATDYTWDGGGGDDVWGTGANWAGDSSPTPSSTNNLVFSGTTRLTPQDNYGDGDDFQNITFDSTAGAFTISNTGSNGIDWFGSITNNSSNTQTIGFRLYQSASNTINANTGNITLNSSALIFRNSQALTLSASSGRTITIASQIADGGGAGSAISVTGGGTVNLRGANTFTSGIIIRNGTLVGDVNGGTLGTEFGTGTIQIGDSATGADAKLTDAGFGSQTNAITVDSGAGTRTLSTSSNNGGQSPTFSGNITLNNNLIVAAEGAGTLRLTGTINDGASSFGVTVDSAGTGDVRLNAANTFDGGVTIKRGSVEMQSSASALGTGTLTLGGTTGSNNATLRTSVGLTATNAITVAAGNSGTNALRNDSTSGSTFSGNVALNNNLTLQANNTGGLTLSGTITNTGTNTVTNAGTSTGGATLSVILGNGTGVVSVVQNSASSGLTMNVANTFTGGLTVLAGTAQTNNNNGFGATGSTVLLGGTGNSSSATLLFTSNPSGIKQPVIVTPGGTRTIIANNSVSSGNGAVWDSAQPITLNGDLHVLESGSNAGNLQFRNVFSGTGNLIVDYSGFSTSWVEIRGVNTWTGNLQVLGTVRISTNTTALHNYNDVYIGSTGIMDWRIGATIGGLSDLSGSGGTINDNGGTSQTLTIGGTNGGGYSFSGLITNGTTAAVLSLTKSGNITQTLSGSNTYTGVTTVSGGALKLGHASALGASGTGSATTLSTSGTLDLNGFTTAETLNISGAGVLANTSGSAAALTVDANVTSNFTVNATGDITATRFIGTGVARTITKEGAGTLTTNGSSHNNLAAWNINAGTVVFANTSGFGADRGVTINSGTMQLSGANTNLINDGQAFTMNGGAFDLNGKSETIYLVSGSAGAAIKNTLTSSTSTLTLSGTTSLDFAGSLQDGAGVLALTKSGTGTQTLSGSSAFSGAISVSAGGLVVNGTINQGGGGNAGRLSVSSGATLGGSGTIKLSDSNAGLTGLTVSGITAPGASVGTLTLDGANSTRAVAAFETGATFAMELNTGVADKIALVNGQSNDIYFYFNVINFSDLSGGTLNLVDGYTLFSSDVADAFAQLTVNANNVITAGLTIGTGLGAYSDPLLLMQGNNIVLVPEPGTFGMLLGGIGMLALFRRRRA